MNAHFKVTCIQNCADNDIDQNVVETTRWIELAAAQGSDFVCLPENFSCIEHNDTDYLKKALAEQNHPVIEHFSLLAKNLNLWLLLGSVTVRASADKVNNRSILLNNNGEVVSRYNKLHLFDVQLKNQESYRESNTVAPGKQAVVTPLPWGKLGLSICYDLRFAYLYRSLAHAGADFISIPAAFTQTTGQAHWRTLVCARAIETGCYIFAPNQCGLRSTGRETYGHSLIVDPWGEILAEADNEPGVISAEIFPQKAAEVRGMIPALEHDRDYGLKTEAEY